MRDPVQNFFATRNMDFVLERLPVFDQQFQQINQKYNWVEWSTDLDFWDRTYQALRSEIPRTPTVNPDMLLEDIDGKLRFLKSFASVPKDEVRGTVGRILSFLKRLQHRGAIERSL